VFTMRHNWLRSARGWLLLLIAGMTLSAAIVGCGMDPATTPGASGRPQTVNDFVGQPRPLP
jgi:hypothetical protein